MEIAEKYKIINLEDRVEKLELASLIFDYRTTLRLLQMLSGLISLGQLASTESSGLKQSYEEYETDLKVLMTEIDSKFPNRLQELGDTGQLDGSDVIADGLILNADRYLYRWFKWITRG